MPEPKQEELDSLPGSSEGENQDGLPGEGDPSNKPETVEELKAKLLKEQKARGDFETAFYKEREKNRTLPERPIEAKPEIPPDPYDEDTRIDQRVQKAFEKEKEENRTKAKDKALAKFVSAFPQYNPKNDPDDYNYGRLREKANITALGDTEDEIYQNLIFIHNGLNPKSNEPDPKPKVEDSGIGDTTVQLKGTEKKPSYMTRPLTEDEKRAASCFPGGEMAWRKKRAVLDGEKVS